ncbi:MAG: hypothetical protein COX46_05210 [bacterium (Candidatus Ratteibacteria) CG23_combo_of_CG06-09_8_20_14_all_48_7]|uniref:SatD n=1 Tax=bacterium (Candidatus Ratteibacteria) CG23_combo_of_CG06-09_8_20_14_all_48_7 TaxID=2014292 RepID=A0A2G9Y8X9_9BACT|nr:MAG: hypothetical protein COX46_05210 [bacterium (Candidatus Ratteibacteria) CG23_combo_of_CG06-09_8_20_14_all_48_7]
MKGDKNYCVIIGDLVASKKLPERGKVQKQLQKIIAKINYKFPGYFISPFTITRGDEIAALPKDISFVPEIVSIIEREMSPLKVRFGVGLGKITTLLYKDAAAVDGPAFYQASDSLGKAKKENVTIVFNTEKPVLDTLINALESLLYLIKDSWTEQQRKIALFYSQYENQREVAKKMDISQPAVTKTLKSISYKKVKQAEEAVDYLLEDFPKSSI